MVQWLRRGNIGFYCRCLWTESHNIKLWKDRVADKILSFISELTESLFLTKNRIKILEFVFASTKKNSTVSYRNSPAATMCEIITEIFQLFWGDLSTVFMQILLYSFSCLFCSQHIFAVFINSNAAPLGHVLFNFLCHRWHISISSRSPIHTKQEYLLAFAFYWT